MKSRRMPIMARVLGVADPWHRLTVVFFILSIFHHLQILISIPKPFPYELLSFIDLSLIQLCSMFVVSSIAKSSRHFFRTHISFILFT